MFIILEHNGDYVMGVMMKADGSGDNETFDTEEEAEVFAKENCAFEYEIVGI